MAQEIATNGDGEARATAVLPAFTGNELTDDALRDLANSADAYGDAEKLLSLLYGGIDDASEVLGNGFTLLSHEDKAKLIGVGFVALKWSFHQGDHGEFVSAVIIARDGGRYILNDGSTGIWKSLRDYTNRTGRQVALRVPRGLRESTYATCKSCNKPRDPRETSCLNMLPNDTYCGDESTERGTGRTFYLDVTAV